jgi:GH18 family chitinase
MKSSLYRLLLFICLFSACTSSKNLSKIQAKGKSNNAFKVIGYYYYVPIGPAAADLELEGLTHINYSFAIPAKEGYGLEPIKNSDNLQKLVEIAHGKGKKVFISLGGWNLGDGGGDDSRFHRIAATEAGRKAFIQDVMALTDRYKLDGVDMDWEYPDADVSADHFVLLMQALGEALHKQGKELTAAVVSYNGRLGSNGKVSSALGIKKEVFGIADWINIMAYDDENGKPYPNPHSTYALAEKCLNYWIDERGLPAQKAVLGLPYYAKPGYISYKKLLEQGANPAEDTFNQVFYNGTETIKAKTRLAFQKGCSGVMMWEISQDVKGGHSLTKAINEAIRSF